MEKIIQAIARGVAFIVFSSLAVTLGAALYNLIAYYL